MADHDRPFLPDAVPDGSAQGKRQTRRMLFVWVLLIGTFLVIWQVLDAGPDQGAAPPSHSACSPPLWNNLLTVLLPVGVMILIFALFVRRFAGARTFNTTQMPGIVALAEGRASDAVALLRATLGKYAKKSVYHSVAQINVGQAAVHAGLLDDALAAFAAAERGAGPYLGADVRVLAACELAQANALVGDVPTAQRWGEAARARLGKAMGDRLGLAGQLCLAEALVLARAGQPLQALRLLDDSWLKLRHALTGNRMRTVEVIAAFALDAAGPAAAVGLKDSADVAARLARITPVLPDEMAFLGARWPEFRAFLHRHGLASQAGG